MNNLHGNTSCNCNSNLAANIDPWEIIYVIVVDAFVPWETEAQAKTNISLENYLCNWNCKLARNNLLKQCLCTVRAERNTELILERADPVIFETFFAGIQNFQTDPSILSYKKGKAWKVLEVIINPRRCLSCNNIRNFLETNSWKQSFQIC